MVKTFPKSIVLCWVLGGSGVVLILGMATFPRYLRSCIQGRASATQYFVLSQTHQLKPTIDICCCHVQEEQLGPTNSRAWFGWTGGSVADWTTKWHCVSVSGGSKRAAVEAAETQAKSVCWILGSCFVSTKNHYLQQACQNVLWIVISN